MANTNSIVTIHMAATLEVEGYVSVELLREADTFGDYGFTRAAQSRSGMRLKDRRVSSFVLLTRGQS